MESSLFEVQGLVFPPSRRGFFFLCRLFSFLPSPPSLGLFLFFFPFSSFLLRCRLGIGRSFFFSGVVFFSLRDFSAAPLSIFARNQSFFFSSSIVHFGDPFRRCDRFSSLFGKAGVLPPFFLFFSCNSVAFFCEKKCFFP